MSEQTIDQLNIEINQKAGKNNDELEKLANSIQRLKSSVGAGVDKLSGIAASFNKLGTAISELKSRSSTISSLTNSISKLNGVETNKISGNINTLVTSLKTLSGMDPELKSMIADLGSLSRSGNGCVAENALSLQAAAAKAQAIIDKSAFTSAKAQEGLKAIADKNQQIEETARTAAREEQDLTDSINRAIQEHVSQFGGAGAMSNETSKEIPASALPDYGASKSFTGPSRLATSAESLKAAVGDVGHAATAAVNEVSNGSSRATSFVNRMKESFSSAKDQIVALGSSSQSAFRLQNFYGWYFILRQIASTIGGFITNINSYIENMNLFSVAMGKAADSGERLANNLQGSLGIDAGEAMRYMGVFEQLTSSFGVVNKQSTLMSENLTELGYDLASFYNISTTQSFEKLESGITGQSRALRALGIDTSSARLQEELYSLGFKEKVKDLTEADKAILRYRVIMEQTTHAQGDMARTIQTPANALRVLQAQLAITGRAIGSIFIPALEAILPPVTAVIEVIGDLASELASLLGFKLPKIDYSSLNTGLSGVADDADKAANGVGDIGKNAKNSKKQLDNLISGFDELHILQTDSDSDSGSNGKGGAGTGSILSGIDLPSYNALSTAISNNIDSLKKKIRDFLDELRTDPLKVFADAIWGMNGAFGGLSGWLSKMDYADILNGITAAIIGFGLTKNPLLALAIGAVAAAISHFLPQKAKIDLLNGSLIALGGALLLKAFTGMPFKLAIGISTLVESGLIELIGKDNAIDLLTASLTGLGTGILAFSFTGNLPLSVGIGLVSAAISGLAIHFSDMQIAPALLSGVTSGLLAFKLGMDSWSAGAVGLGVALASFAELNNIATPLKVGLLGIAGAVTALGLAFQAGFGLEGLVISAIAGAFIGLGAGLIQASKDAQKADLEKRFGTIKLSAQDCEDIAERLTKTPWTVKVDAAIDANDKLKDLEKNIKTDVDTLNKLNWKVSIGMQLTKGEISDYKQTINSFISDAKSYIQQEQYSVTLAINASYTPGSNTAKNLEQFVNTYYGNAQKQLDSLGKQLSDEVNKAFSDGILTEGEYLKISSIEQKMQKIIDKISDAEYKAKLDNLTADVSGKGLTADSFKDLQTQIQKTAQDRLSKADVVRLKTTAVAEMQWKDSKQTEADKEAFDKAKADAQNYFNQQKAKIDLTGLNVSLDTLKSKFSIELSKMEPSLSSGVKEAFKNGFYVGIGNPTSQEEVYKQPVTALISGMELSYSQGLYNSNISGTTKKELASLISALQPTEADLKQIAVASLKAGEQVPENVAKGISDIEQMKAITGDSAAIDFEIGKKLSTDPDFINLLATSKDAGKSVDKNTAAGLTDNLQLVRDSATGAITGVKDSITGKVTAITPDLKQNLKELGVDMSNSLVTGTANNGANTKAGAKMCTDTATGAKNKEPDLKKQMGDIGTNASGALTTSAQNKLKSDNAIWKVMFSWLPLWARQVLGIASPSKVFTEIGNNIIQGLWNGIQDTWKDFTGWWDNLKLKLPHIEIEWNNLDGLDKNVKKVLKKMGIDGIPELSVQWYKSGGVFDSASVIGVGEYANATTNPEVVAPQSIIRETVEESNEGMVAVLAQILEVAQKIAEKDTTVNLDGKKISESNNKYNANRGYNLGLQST